MMDSAKYLENTLKKIEIYEMNNINVIYTFETTNMITKTELIDSIIKNRLLDN